MADRRGVAFALALSLIVGGCPEPARDATRGSPAASWPCSNDRAGLIRRAVRDAEEENRFANDIRALEGVRDGEGPELANATDFVDTAFRQNGFAVTRQTVKGRRGRRAQENVIAEIRGEEERTTGSGPIIIATAHLDTVTGSPGADDNASGLATLLAIARATYRARSEDCNVLRATVRLAAFGREETGLRGSFTYVSTLPISERQRIRAVYNFDMTAYGRASEGTQAWPAEAQILVDIDPSGKRRPLRTRGDFIGVIGLANEPGRVALWPLREARAYVPGLAIEGGAIPPILLPFAPDFERGDHLPFWRAGIPAVTIGDTAELRNPNYHSPSDKLETLDLALGAKVARWGAVAMLIAASRPSRDLHSDKQCWNDADDPNR